MTQLSWGSKSIKTCVYEWCSMSSGFKAISETEKKSDYECNVYTGKNTYYLRRWFGHIVANIQETSNHKAVLNQ